MYYAYMTNFFPSLFHSISTSNLYGKKKKKLFRQYDFRSTQIRSTMKLIIFVKNLGIAETFPMKKIERKKKKIRNTDHKRDQEFLNESSSRNNSISPISPTKRKSRRV